jgi:hypothetical protein
MVIDDKVVSAKLFKEIVVVRRVHQRVIYTEEEEKKKKRHDSIYLHVSLYS